MQNSDFVRNSDPASRSGEDVAHIQQLALETDTPIELVKEVYCTERAKMERSARIKTYVPVLVHQHVKSLLRERRAT